MSNNSNPVVNLTQHHASPEQIEAGVRNLGRQELHELLTFNELPTPELVEQRARQIAELAVSEGAKSAMIGGAPFLMGPLERALVERGIEPLYAYSKRASVEETLPDGSVRKVAVFRHLGFVGSNYFNPYR